MRDLCFFDANCELGAPMNAQVFHAGTVADLYAEMDRVGVDKALVRYLNMENGAAFANDRIADLLADDKDRRLVGVWHILPGQCDELPHGEAFFEAMQARRIGALRLLPGPQRWVPCALAIGSVMEAAEERRIPVLVSHTAFADDWGGLYRFLAEFPRNRYLLSADSLWGTDRQVRPLLEHYEGVHFELSTYWVPEGVRDLVRLYGADRILYGSGFPRYNQGAMMSAVRHAEITDEEKALVASGNLERLLAEERR